MTRQEFIDKTGFIPSHSLYTAIENAYMKFDGDKDSFCEAYKGNTNRIAEIIALSADADLNKELDSRDKLIDELKHQAVGLKSDILFLNDQVEELEDQLDKELDWKPCKTVGTQMTQADYQDLSANEFTKSMTGEEAANFIAEELGFDPKKVEIIQQISQNARRREVQARATLRFNRMELRQI